MRRLSATLALLALSAMLGSCTRDNRTPLVVYSPHDKDLLSYFKSSFEAAHPDIDVQWVDMGSQDILDRLRSEKANPQADVWFGAPAETFNRGTAEGLIDPYTPTWANAVPADAHEAGNHWYGTYLTPEVIAYNSDAVTAAQAPADWDDVLAPQWRNKIIIRDPVASGSMRAIWGAILARSIARTGSTASGWDWLRRLDSNTKEYVINPTMLYQELGQRIGTVSLWDMPDIATLQAKKTFPLGYRIPSSGTPLLVDAIAIVHGSKHAAAAQAFYEFVTTPHALQEAATRFNRIPVRTDLVADSLPGWVRDARAQIKPMAVDQKLIADSLDSWMKYWDAHIRNCCHAK